MIRKHNKLKFKLLLQDKVYAKNDENRILLMKKHLKTAWEISQKIEPFELEKFEELGELSYFYAAKGNVRSKEDLLLKKETFK